MAVAGYTKINTNISALNAMNALSNINSKLGIHQARLATGLRVNTAADDAAGMTIARKFTVRADGLGAALSNIGDARNLLAVAEGNLQKINEILTTMKTRATQSANDVLGVEERAAIASELGQLAEEITAEAEQATWNAKELLQGTDTEYTFQIGAGTADTLTVDIVASSGATTTGGFTAVGLSVSTIDVSTGAASRSYMTTADTAIRQVSRGLAYIGAIQNRLTIEEESVAVAQTNTIAARSRIMDADMAAEQLESMKWQILQQTATAMLAQANTLPQSVLALFR